MKQMIRIGMLALLFAGCTSTPPAPIPSPSAPDQPTTGTQTTSKPEPAARYEGPGHSYATAIQLSGAGNPLAFSQKQQEWLWLHYRDWKKQGQALRQKDGLRYDEVSLVNQKGETRVIYFRMPERQKP